MTLHTFVAHSLGYLTGVIGFDEALRREIRRHANSGVGFGQSRQAIVSDALAAQLVETLRHFAATLRGAVAPTSVRLPGGGRFRKPYSPAGFVVHELRADSDDAAVSPNHPSLLRRLALVTADAQLWVWQCGSSLAEPPVAGYVPVTGLSLRERRLPLEDGRIAVGENSAGEPAAVLDRGEPPLEPVEDVLTRIADRIVRR